MSPMGLVKFLGAWGCITAAVVLMVLGHQLAGLPMNLAILSVAFSLALPQVNMTEAQGFSIMFWGGVTIAAIIIAGIIYWVSR